MFYEYVAQPLVDAALLDEPLQLERNVGEAFAAGSDPKFCVCSLQVCAHWSEGVDRALIVKVHSPRQLIDATERATRSFFSRGPVRRVTGDLFQKLIEHQSLQMASAMAFDLFLALVPLLALAGWVVSLVLHGNENTMANLSALLNLAPDDVQRVINHHAERFSGKAIAPLALVGGIWLGSGAFDTVMSAFERTGPSDPRPWWVRRGIAVLCVPSFLGSLGLGAWVALHAAGSPIFDNEVVKRVIRASDVQIDTAQTIGFLVSAVTITLFIAAFFRIAVRRDVPRRRVWPGTLLTLSIGSVASYGFATYAGRLAQYAVYYGSLAAVAVLLFWLWICSLALLLGAELNVYMEEQFAVESRRPPALAEPAPITQRSRGGPVLPSPPQSSASSIDSSAPTHSPQPSGKPPTA
jgi:membrane protein